MWLFTKYGFFSVVCARKKNGTPDYHRLMIRARKRQHLVQLQTAFPRLKKYPLFRTDDTDYRFRLIVPRSLWAAVQSAVLAQVDYDNFKAEVHQQPGMDDYYATLNSVWAVMRRLQPLSKTERQQAQLRLQPRPNPYDDPTLYSQELGSPFDEEEDDLPEVNHFDPEFWK